MTNQSPALPVDDRLTLRGSADFEIIAQIRNDAARKRDGDRMTPVDANLMESLVSSPERFCIAQVGQDSAGFCFVARAGSAHEYLNEILAEAGFREMLRYYRMQLEMTAPPPRAGRKCTSVRGLF
jgi:hypothetical protein